MKYTYSYQFDACFVFFFIKLNDPHLVESVWKWFRHNNNPFSNTSKKTRFLVSNPINNPISKFTNVRISQVKLGVRSREQRENVSMISSYHKSVGFSFVRYGKVSNWRFRECILVMKLRGRGAGHECCEPTNSSENLILPSLRGKSV